MGRIGIDRSAKEAYPTLPPSLAVQPNIPWSEQTLEQLEAEAAYWREAVERAPSFASAKSADDYRKGCEVWIARKKAELDEPQPPLTTLPWAEQTLEQLEAEAVYWREKAKAYPGYYHRQVLRAHVKACEDWIARKKGEADKS